MATILIAEDNTMIGMMMQMDLEGAGHRVLGPAVNNSQALLLAREAPCDLALVDIDLKGGDSGLVLAQLLRGEHGMPTLFVSGQVAEAVTNASLAIGVLTKPFQSSSLIATVEKALAYADGGEKPDSGSQAMWF